MADTPTTPATRAAQEAALEAARDAQTTFWNALSDLEVALGGIEIEDNADLSTQTVDSLLAGDDDDDGDAQLDDDDDAEAAK